MFAASAAMMAIGALPVFDATRDFLSMIQSPCRRVRPAPLFASDYVGLWKESQVELLQMSFQAQP